MRGSLTMKKLRTLHFNYFDYGVDGIEQKPHAASSRASLAREGKRVMQFSYKHRYFADVCKGKLTHRPSWYDLRLPE